MAATKHPKDYSVDEVCIFMNAIGLGQASEKVRENSIDGGFLVTLTPEDYVDLGLTKIQGKKVIHSIELQEEFFNAGGLDRIKELEEENAKLRAQLAVKDAAPGPAPIPAPAPAPAPPRSQSPTPSPQHQNPPSHHSPKTGHAVVAGGARGAVAGATLGAIGGAIAGDPRKGAKIGAAVGGTRGAARGLLGRR